MNLTQVNLIFNYYKQHSDRDIPHTEVVDWATQQWLEKTGKVFRDPDRAIRKLHQQNQLIQVAKGIYRYNPTPTSFKGQLFTEKQKQQILKRDNYKCAICGQGRAEGKEVHADHIKPYNKDGDNSLDNGQTLCSKHNNFKRDYSQTESGKRMFLNLHKLSQKNGDLLLSDFSKEILEVYEKYDINGHIF